MKKFIYVYLRSVAIILIIIGLSFSITSLNNIYGVIFSNDIIYEQSNLCLMFGGVLSPLFMLVIGLYIYFNVDYKPKNLQFVMLVFSLVFTIFGLFNILDIAIEYRGLIKELTQVYYFLNKYYMYITFIVGISLMYGAFNYHYLVKTKRSYRKGMNKYGYKHLLWKTRAVY